MKILTFDIEDWFHLLDLPIVENPEMWNSFESRIHEGVAKILALLDRKKLKATFFILGWIAEHYPEIVVDIESRGHTIGTHSYHHRLVYKQTPSEFEYDLQKSQDVIASLINKPVTMYRAPGFSITPECLWAFKILEMNGITADFSVFGASRRHGGMPSMSFSKPFKITFDDNRFIKELPISNLKALGKSIIFSGGGYFRITPYPIIKRIFLRQSYLMTYFHPRDFDPAQPRLPMPAIRSFQTYVGLRSAYDKLDALTNKFDFTDATSAISQIDWASVPSVDVAC